MGCLDVWGLVFSMVTMVNAAKTTEVQQCPENVKPSDDSYGREDYSDILKTQDPMICLLPTSPRISSELHNLGQSSTTTSTVMWVFP